MSKFNTVAEVREWFTHFDFGLNAPQNFTRRFLTPQNFNGMHSHGLMSVGITNNETVREDIDQYCGIGYENQFLGCSAEVVAVTDLNHGEKFHPTHLVEAGVGLGADAYNVILGKYAFECLSDPDWSHVLNGHASVQHDLVTTGYITSITMHGQTYNLFTDALLPKSQQFMDGDVIVGPVTPWGEYNRQLTIKVDVDCDQAKELVSYSCINLNLTGIHTTNITAKLARIEFEPSKRFDETEVDLGKTEVDENDPVETN